MISAILARSGGPPAAAFSTSNTSRKYCGPIAAGVMTQSDLRVLAPEIVEPVNRAARNAQRLSRSDLDRVGRRRSTSARRRGRRSSPRSGRGCGPEPAGAGRADGELEGRDAAGGLIRGEQEADRQRPEVDASHRRD